VILLVVGIMFEGIIKFFRIEDGEEEPPPVKEEI